MFGWGVNKGPTVAQKAVGDLLFNDAIHVLSSFQLNRIASLTYGDDVCDQLFEMLEELMRKPEDHSVLTLQKSLVVTRHVMIYGSEKTVNSAIVLQRGVEQLPEYNTVLINAKKQGAAGFFQKIKGGGVDEGHPVREAAQKVFPLMLDTNKLRALRNSKADPNSLVPVGTDEVAFISDDVRHYLLKKRIEQQFRLETKSNLASASGGFGAGYVGSNGKNVVGAAHGLEEMIKQAEIANRKFTDEGQSGNYQLPKLSDFSDYEAPGSAAAAAKANASHSNPQQQGAASVDLLDFSAGVSQPQAAAPEIDLLGGFGDVGGGGSSGGAAIDIFGAPSDQITINLNPSPALAVGGGGLLDFGAATAGVDPFAGLSGGGGMGGATGDLLGTTSTSDQGVGSLLDFGGMSNDPSHDPLAHAGGLLDVGKPASGNHAMGGISNSLLGLGISGGAPPKDETRTMMASADSGATKNVMGGSSIMGNYVMSSNSDRFAALDTLDIPIAASASWNAQEAENRLLGSGSSAPTSSKSLGDMGTPSLTVTDGSTTSDALPSSSGLSDMAFAIPSEPMTIPPISGGLKIAQSVPWSSGVDGAATEDYGNDDGFGMAMGGGMGAGLEPAAPAPGAPPPPPPPR